MNFKVGNLIISNSGKTALITEIKILEHRKDQLAEIRLAWSDGNEEQISDDHMNFMIRYEKWSIQK
jgi:molybdopterin-guanine dinucleotide biosynthesis protein